ncbi:MULTISPECIES: hypothetical protein [unclassified Campylobacter]|uniref:hypothetical protein n=1 Tax=Campylobacter TaxID=194 RepID=UPI0014739BD6|nr:MULTISPECIES: hypothetical protein [unclassified Campylobacter]QKF91505.1 hypothetical protein CORI_0272 [Campylobacter sp. CCUG 57310]
MANISEFLVSVVELVEAQADDIRHSFFKSADSFLILVVAHILAIIGFVFFLIGLNILLVSMFNEVAAYLTTACIAFISAFIFYRVALWKTK